jgi:hypothetical protein
MVHANWQLTINEIVNELGYFIRISTGKADRGTTDDAG